MTSDNGTTKSQAAPKAASTPSEAAAKPDGPPSNYSRGEGQKPVTGTYKDNWNRIYGKKKQTK